MDLTPAELTVLGLIVERPQHGYDLERIVQARGIRQWTEIGFSSIYYLLGKLEKRGLICVPEAHGTAKSRRVFHSTPAGRDAAASNAQTLIVEARPVPQPVLVGVSNLTLLTEDQYVRALRARLEQIDARIAAVRHAEQSPAPLALPAREVFSYSLCLLEAERSWLATRAQVSDDEQD